MFLNFMKNILEEVSEALKNIKSIINSKWIEENQYDQEILRF